MTNNQHVDEFFVCFVFPPLRGYIVSSFVCFFVCLFGLSQLGLGALGLNTYIFTFALYVFGFLATVPTPFVASARARGDEAGAAKWV